MDREDAVNEPGEVSGNMFDREDPASAEAAPQPEKQSRGWWKIVVLLVVLLLIGFVVVLKYQRAEGPTGAKPQAGKVESGLVLATVNGEKLTWGYLEQRLQKAPEDIRPYFEDEKHELLEQLIGETVLLQEARRLSLQETEDYQQARKLQPNSPEDLSLVFVLLKKEVYEKANVTDDEVRELYEREKDNLPGRPSFKDAETVLRRQLLQRKEYEQTQNYVESMKEKADVARNEEWIEAQKAAAADNPLGRALKEGLPVLAEFGGAECVPCKIMKPILERLAEDLKGRVRVLIIDLDEYANLGRRQGVRIIPTQVFYDASGKEVFRHEGLMPREDILEKLAEIGVAVEDVPSEKETPEEE